QIALSGIDLADSSLADAPEVTVPDDEAAPAPAKPTEDAAPAAADTGAADSAPAVADVAATRAAEPAAPRTSAPAGPTSEPARPAAAGTPPVPTRYADIKPVAETSGLGAGSGSADSGSTDSIDPASVKAVLLSPDDTPTPDPEAFADITASGGSGTHGDIAARQPSIISRSGWGADESIRCRSASYDPTLAAAVVHHT